MKKVALKLIENAIHFEYHHHMSEGEEIIVRCMGVKIRTNKGKLILKEGFDIMELEESEAAWKTVLDRLQILIIEETT